MNADDESLFELMFAVLHRSVATMHHVAGFEEWSAPEVLALRAIARSSSALSTADVARALGISWTHASKICGRLKANGLLSEFRWKKFRGLRLTADGTVFLQRELPNLTAFVRGLFHGLGPDERVILETALQRIRSNVCE